jgi:hypothetical protein
MSANHPDVVIELRMENGRLRAEIERLRTDRVLTPPPDVIKIAEAIASTRGQGLWQTWLPAAKAVHALLSPQGTDQPTNRALPPALDRETVQTLLDLLNPLHGSLDEQTYDEKADQNFDAPADAVYSVEVTAQMERDLTQAVKILESRRRDTDQPTLTEPRRQP